MASGYKECVGVPQNCITIDLLPSHNPAQSKVIIVSAFLKYPYVRSLRAGVLFCPQARRKGRQVHLALKRLGALELSSSTLGKIASNVLAQLDQEILQLPLNLNHAISQHH